MRIADDEALFNNDLCARTRALRDDLHWTAEQMATALGIPADRYRKYEVRSPIPAYLMERFCLITNVDFDYLLTGKGNRVRSKIREVIETKPKRKNIA